MTNQRAVPPYRGVLLSNLKDWTADDSNILDESTGIVLSEKIVDPKILYNSIYITFWNDRVLEMEDRLMVDTG